jgi:cytochrome c biogenesis protein CcmG, thiol:disulfide interchange protein DsbE
MSGSKPKGQKQHSAQRGSARPTIRKTWIAGGVVAVLLAALFAVVAQSGNPDASTEAIGSSAVEPTSSGELQPSANSATDVAAAKSTAVSLAIQDFDGNTMTLADLEGRPVVVNFWAAWCPACFAEMPAFEKVFQATGDSVQFLGIGLIDDLDAALSVVEETGVTYPLAQDPRGQVFAAFGGFGMPTTVFLDENGAVVEMYTGELTADDLAARIAEYFGN